MKEKELVTLRQKPMKNGGQSLYLDYAIDGIRYKEYLKMYLVPGESKIKKHQNEQTLKTAQAMKAKRILELQDGKAGFNHNSRKDILFADYIKQRSADYRNRGHVEFSNTLNKIARWTSSFRRVSLRNVTKEYAVDFIQFMRNGGLAESTIYVYFSNLNSLLNFAYRDGLIPENPLHRMDKTLKPGRPESTREYLTLEEVQKLIDTPIHNDEIKQAFLFSCFTGLRLSDIESLKWGAIKPAADGWQIETRQIKTRKIVMVPLSDNALSFLPPRRGEPSEKVWKGFPCRPEMARQLKVWIKHSGIGKEITFHCARHTNATLLLTYGVDIYTVSSLLGHTHIETTQIYAKVISAKKTAAVNLIPTIASTPAMPAPQPTDHIH